MKVFAALLIGLSLVSAHTLTATQFLDSEGRIGAGGTMYQGCEMCDAWNWFITVPPGGAGIRAFDASWSGQVSDPFNDIFTLFTSEIPDINQVVCAKTVAMVVGVQGQNIQLHFVHVDTTTPLVTLLLFDDTINGASDNHLVASSKSVNTFAACGTHSASNTWRCAVFDLNDAGTTISRYDFEDAYGGGYVVPGLSFDGLTMIIMDEAAGGTLAFNRKTITTNFTKTGATCMDGYPTFSWGNAIIVPRVQYHRRTLSFVGMYKENNDVTIKLFAIRMTPTPGAHNVASVELDSNTMVGASSTGGVPVDFYFNRFGNDMIVVFSNGTGLELRSNYIDELGHLGIGLAQDAGDYEDEFGRARVIERCPILTNDSFVWATNVEDDDLIVHSYGGDYAPRPTIQSGESGVTVLDEFHAGDELVNGTLILNFTIAEVGTDGHTRVEFIPSGLGLDHADGYDIVKWVDLDTPIVGTYSVTITLSNITAANPESVTVDSGSAYRNITSGMWTVRVSVLHASFDRRHSDPFMIQVVDETPPEITHTSMTHGVGMKDVSDDITDPTKVRAVCQSNDQKRLLILEDGVGLIEYTVDLTKTRREHVFTKAVVHPFTYSVVGASCVYEEDWIVVANATSISMYGFNTTTAVYEYVHVAALNLTGAATVLALGIAVHYDATAEVVTIFYMNPEEVSGVDHLVRAATFTKSTLVFAAAGVSTYFPVVPGENSISIVPNRDTGGIRGIYVNDTETASMHYFTYASGTFTRVAHGDFVPTFKHQNREFFADVSGNFANDELSLSGGLSRALVSVTSLGENVCGHGGAMSAACKIHDDVSAPFYIGNNIKIVEYSRGLRIYRTTYTTTGFPRPHDVLVREIVTVNNNFTTAPSTDNLDCACLCGPPITSSIGRNMIGTPHHCTLDSCVFWMANGAISITAHANSFAGKERIPVVAECFAQGGGVFDFPYEGCGTVGRATCGTSGFHGSIDAGVHTETLSNLGSFNDTSAVDVVHLKSLAKTEIVASGTGSSNSTLRDGSFSQGTANWFIVGKDSKLYWGGKWAGYDDSIDDRNFFTKYGALIIILGVVGFGILGTAMMFKQNAVYEGL